MGATPMLLMLALAGASGENLSDGIRLYRTKNYSESLQALTSALNDHRGSRKKLARVHLYIGLIQFRFGATEDARVSFAEAVRLNPRQRIPRRSPAGARAMFKRAKRRKAAKRAVVPSRSPPKKAEPPPTSVIVNPPKPVDAAPPPPPPSVVPPPPPSTLGASTLTPPDASATTDRTDASNGLRTPGLITAGVGAASLVAGGVILGVAFSTRASAEDERVGTESERLFDSAVTQRNIAVTAGIAGAVLVVGGAIMALSR